MTSAGTSTAERLARSSSVIRLLLLLLFFVLVMCRAAAAQSTAPARPAPAPSTKPFLRNWTRVEAWRFFEPHPGGGDPTYADIANRLQIGVERITQRYELTGAVQYVQFAGLPSTATGPGPLGTGALYFAHSGSRGSHNVYVRYLYARLKDLAPGFSLQVGRFGYASGSESPSAISKIEAVKRQRVDSRLIGEFEWSLYQRSFDGFRADLDRPAWHVSLAGFRPTQGGFEESAGASIGRITVLAASFAMKPGLALPRTDIQGFAYGYSDTRAVRGRPDNTGRSASAADVRIATYGAAILGAYPYRDGEVDVLLWVAAQTGNWYEQNHLALALAAEMGHQWPHARWSPWVRAGVDRASGDAQAADRRHGTFFQMLPTSRKQSLSATYSFMNLADVFAQVLLRPSPKLNLRVDLHNISLARASDVWYAGSGATQRAGLIFGYTTRGSRGARSLGTVLEGSVDYSVNRHWSVNCYVGTIRGGDVVRRMFKDPRLVFGYVENVLQF
ncbi:MAG: alginate export family protein [Acidobacteria bacterium]|nr:alginate export family protein [Acidobacteriota bacterium]